MINSQSGSPLGRSVNDDFIAYFVDTIADRKHTDQSYFNYDVALKYLVRYTKGYLPFKSITNEWITSLHQYLINVNAFKGEHKLSANSAGTYYTIVISVIREAVKTRHIDPLVVKNIQSFKRGKVNSVALTSQELSKLAATECDLPILKKAFLLSALTGLQWNEIKALSGNHIEKVDMKLYQINLVDVSNPRMIPLTTEAYDLLNNLSNCREQIFRDLKWNSYLYIKLNKWAVRTGILRNITFQSARLSFARLLAQEGVPVEIISELLGHRNLKSTKGFLELSPAP